MSLSMDRIEEWIRSGDLKRARAAVERLVQLRVPRSRAAGLASLAVRCGLAELGVKILHRVVRPPPRRVATATERERAEYAHALIKCGAVSEGLALLADVGIAEFPKARLYRAAGLVAQWDYGGAIPLYRQYLESSGLSEYERMVAEVNLAAAWIFEGKVKQASALLRKLLFRSSLKGYRLMLGRALELSAECLIAEHRWERARQFVSQADKRLAGSGGRDELFVRKYRTVIEVYRRKGESRSIALLRAFRSEAVKEGHWETVRHCDYVEATVLQDARLLAHLYFGTPFLPFREKLLADFGRDHRPPLLEYVWGQAEKSGDSPDLDLFDGRTREGATFLEPGSMLHRLLTALLADFYRPQRAAELHARVHPGVFFNPASSRAAIHEGMARLRRRFASIRAPIDIEEVAGGAYRLCSRGPFSIRIAAHEFLARRYAAELNALRVAWPTHPFSTAQAVLLLKLPRRTVCRLLDDALRSGLLVRAGRARATRYAFARMATDRDAA